MATPVPVPFPPLLLCSLGCVLPQCAFVKKAAKVFPSHLGRGVSPGAGPAFPEGGTSPAAAGAACASICLAAGGAEPASSSKHIQSSHTHMAECSALFLLLNFSFEQEIALQKIKAACLFCLLSSHSCLAFPLRIFLAIHIQVSQGLGAEPGLTHLQKLF